MGDDRDDAERREATRRPFIGIHFKCCGVYARVYRSATQPYYLGRCPRCLRPVRVRVGAGGTSARFFEAE
ncbi:MAG: hypothetical protein HRF50_00375 [Phycisphaerae bacterium]